ncbi:MAG: ABC transporter permease [Elusimicrobia bacterium]|nr:ABC transporter permease [Candidatus Obscuribacterium magneticum]
MNALFNTRRTTSIAKKEIHHILRDPFTLTMALGLPLILLTFFGFVIDFNVRNIRLAAVDGDRSRASRQLLEVFESSDYFRLMRIPSSAHLVKHLDEEKAKGVLIIEPGFGKDISRGMEAKAQIILDGADNSTTGTIASYLSGIQRAAIKKLVIASLPAAGGRAKQSDFPEGERQIASVGRHGDLPRNDRLINIDTRFLFNPELNSQWFVIPGLAVIIIGVLSILLTALTISREWETGSMELLLSTPVRPLEIIIGKLSPYLIISLIGVFLVYLAARGLFHVPFQGNHLLFLLGCILFLGCTLTQGLVISVITRQQALAMQLAIVSGLLPSLLLSGFVFPIESMPDFFRYFTGLLPPRWFMIITRGIFLKGAGVIDLKIPLIALLSLNAFLLLIASKKFKKDLEP